MLRVRKYRIFLLVAVASLTIVWYVSRQAPWDEPSRFSGFSGFRGYGQQVPDSGASPDEDRTRKSAADVPLQFEAVKPPAEVVHPNHAATAVFPPDKDKSSTTTTSTSSTTSLEATPEKLEELTEAPEDVPAKETPPADVTDNTAQPDSYKDDKAPSNPMFVWTQRPERFPVSKTIQLPTAPPKTMPKIQHTFVPDPPTVQNEARFCLGEVKKAMKRTWDGYKQFAWLQDELKPVSGGSKDKFMGWAATLVDSLDTLYIMGMEREFNEAVNATAQINFKESTHARIPMFETTIRYLGGLLGAYDISEQKHPVLLEKAVELAEVLIGAFDTPNRMPILYYMFAREVQPNRAERSACLAELGSLSLEFTRLAQLTKEPKYYDAVARITDALAEYQPRTSVPGLWPLHIDTSGCKQDDKTGRYGTSKAQPAIMTDVTYGDGPDVVDTNVMTNTKDAETAAEKLREASANSFADDVDKTPASGAELAGDKLEAALELKEKAKSSFADDVDDVKRSTPAVGGGVDVPNTQRSEGLSKHKRQLIPTMTKEEEEAEYITSVEQAQVLDTDLPPVASDICEPCALQSGSFGAPDRYTLGGEADSTYEYLPKEYLLLGGNVEVYKTMYESTIQAVKDFLLFRPMIDDNTRELRFTGAFKPFKQIPLAKSQKDGQLKPEITHLSCFVGGMLALGAKVFDRPEDLETAAQITDACVWAYASTKTGVMPEDFTPAMCESLESCAWNETAWYLAVDPAGPSRDAELQGRAEYLGPTKTSPDALRSVVAGAPQGRPSVKFADLNKRQLDLAETTAFPGSLPTIAPPHQLSHKEYVQERIDQEGLWPGAVGIGSSHYILRPEAIESVFYLYRITGDVEWRRKGLKMWMAVEKATKTQYGNSAIADVTRDPPEFTNEMESFWPAETLKYFYLLFSDQNLVSLDDFVLNTEAHPFLRPDGKIRAKEFNRGPGPGTKDGSVAAAQRQAEAAALAAAAAQGGTAQGAAP